jgi:alpha,alpha-trehalose phosphorylase
MRDHDGALSFAPRLPPRLTRLAFGICFRDRRLRVEVTRDEARYSLLQGPALRITHHGEAINVTTDQPVTHPIPEIVAGKPPRQPSGRRPKPRRTPGTLGPTPVLTTHH